MSQTIESVKQSRVKARHATRWMLAIRALACGYVLLGGGAARAGELFRDADLSIRWDNTLKYSAGWRLSGRERALIADPNGDDGDRNFSPGLISNRFDLLSELGIAYRNVGFEASAAAWYDGVYNGATDSDSVQPASFYPVPSRVADEVRDLHGRRIELLNAFAYVNTRIGDMPVTLRAGRHTLLWGESVFFAGNGIAAGQAPIDGVKGAGVPAVRAKEVFMPVAQVSATFQPRADLVLAGYYQLEWRKTRIPGVGSYFSAADFLDAGGYRLYVARNQWLSRIADRTPAADGQFGLSLRGTGGAVDWGFYALRFHAREPQVYLRPTPTPAFSPAAASAATVERALAYGYTPGIVGSTGTPTRLAYPFGVGLPEGNVGNYFLVYPRGIEIYGASISSYVGDSTLAGEMSVRRHMPLVSALIVAQPGRESQALYARGDTAHAQVSFSTTLSPSSLWRTAELTAEIAANHRLRVDLNPGVLDPTRNRFAASIRVLFEPRYFAVLPGLDVGVPISVGHGIAGRSSVDASQDPATGDVTVGLSLTYRTVWLATVGMTRFLGRPDRQPFADRDYISLSLQRTF